MYMYVYNMCAEVCSSNSSMRRCVVHSVCMVYSV